ncbi:hypothetical protein ACKI1K_08355 [Streptomyces scabiei]|uniref:hypothetical protein n=1 Tax=Streptomyces scabiei TaxID=1930 RepID=UPI0038F69D24
MAAPRSETPSTWTVLALFAAAALLAITGFLLLLGSGPTIPDAIPSTSSKPSNLSAAPSAAQPQPTGSAVRPEQETTAADEAPARPSIPVNAAEIARRFVLAWAAHDARPGHDTSFSDASRRAAAYATDELAAQLRGASERSAYLWQQWVSDETRVACSIDRVTTPDGAPAPTETQAYARVLYTCTTHTADRRSTRSPDQLALEMNRTVTGAWQVSAIVNA